MSRTVFLFTVPYTPRISQDVIVASEDADDFAAHFQDAKFIRTFAMPEDPISYVIREREAHKPRRKEDEL